jgi:hypothetical protein
MISFLAGLLANESNQFYSQNNNFGDNLPYIWYEFEKQGYVTSFQIDVPDWDFITSGDLRGFSRSPTGFYARPFWIQYRKLRWKSLFTYQTI